MTELFTILRRESIYIWYYFEIQFRQICGYWILGMLIGSFISVFAKNKIHGVFAGMKDKKWGLFGVVPACLLGIASPLCMYGTIPIAASFRKQGMREDWLAAFMMASILLNPQLIIYSAALGTTALIVRIVSCFLCGCAAGLLVFAFYQKKDFFDFTGFESTRLCFNGSGMEENIICTIVSADVMLSCSTHSLVMPTAPLFYFHTSVSLIPIFCSWNTGSRPFAFCSS